MMSLFLSLFYSLPYSIEKYCTKLLMTDTQCITILNEFFSLHALSSTTTNYCIYWYAYLKTQNLKHDEAR